IFFEGNIEDWKSYVFDPAGPLDSNLPGLYSEAGHVVLRGDSSLFLRGGEFGMGGAGFSSHAHNDLLAPILWLDGIPVLVDPGTYVYNGDTANRAKYRSEWAHNSFIIGDGTPARQKFNF